MDESVKKAAEGELGILARRRIEAAIIAPIYDEMRQTLGEEQARDILRRAIRRAAIDSGAEMAERTHGDADLEGFKAILPLWTKDDALTIEVIDDRPGVLDFNVRRCRYAETYRAMGLGDIGDILSCNRDGAFCEGYDPRIKLERTQDHHGWREPLRLPLSLERGTADLSTKGKDGVSSIPDTMTAVIVEGGKGPADALKAAQAPTPKPGPGELLIRVKGAGVNRPDIIQRMGFYPPPPGAPDILGLEVAGEVAAVGENITRWSVGDPVCALLGGGGYAEYAKVDARHTLPIPKGLTLIEAAALPETAFTVFTNIMEGGALKSGETFVVHGATSGIGVMAIQMAKAAGARVIATSRSAGKAAAALKLGADISIDTKAEDFVERIKAEGGADVILDMVGGAYTPRNLACLKLLGRNVLIATQGGAKAEIDLMRLMRDRLVLTGSTLRPRSADEKARLAAAVEARVWPWIEAGAIKPIVAKTFPLAEAGAAHAYVESGSHVGKVVLLT